MFNDTRHVNRHVVRHPDARPVMGTRPRSLDFQGGTGILIYRTSEDTYAVHGIDGWDFYSSKVWQRTFLTAVPTYIKVGGWMLRQWITLQSKCVWKRDYTFHTLNSALHMFATPPVAIHSEPHVEEVVFAMSA